MSDTREVPVAAAVLASHFGAAQLDRVRQYARRLASHNKRIGLVEVDNSECRLYCFDGHAHSEIESPGESIESQPPMSLDARRIREALAEMAWDVEQWLILLPTPRLPESRALLKLIPQWVVLSTGDHDGVVAAYRTMKGLACDLESDAGSIAPRISLSVVDADAMTAERVHRKLAGVCDEFLGMAVEAEMLEDRGTAVAEHLVMHCKASQGVQHADEAHWQIVGDFLSGAGEAESAAPEQSTIEVETPKKDETFVENMQMPNTDSSPFVSDAVESVVSPEESLHFKEPLPEALNMHESHSSIPMTFPTNAPAMQDDVIDLLSNDSSETGIIAAVMRRGFGAGNLIECPIAPPMRASSRLAVTRERRLTLIAVARQGLSDLRSIGETYRWLVENRPLIAMALPQMSIDAHAMPHLNLLIDQTDTSAELLQPLLSASHVTVRAYRTLRWGGRTGLLLEAA